MDDSSPSTLSTGAKVTRWTARIFSALILLSWGFFIVAHLFGDGEEASQPLHARDYVGLITMGAWLVGLAVAWKWEFTGGLMALVAYVIAAAANPNVVLFPFVIIPVTALLFLASWWMRRARGEGTVEAGASRDEHGSSPDDTGVIIVVP